MSLYDENEEQRLNIIGRLMKETALHPFDYANVLMHLGYEPIHLVSRRSIWDTPIKILPNIIEYTKHIFSTDGLFGLYRGLQPKLLGSICSAAFSEKIADRLGFKAPEKIIYKDFTTDDQYDYQYFKLNLKRDVIVAASEIILAHPFHVIANRMMAQFIGRESLYTSIKGSIAEIYKTDGISGFFSGLVPKLLCNIAYIVLTSSTVYLIERFITKNESAIQFSAVITEFYFSTKLYPLKVISTCMSVIGSNLMAGQPPMMPASKNCLDCLNYLLARNKMREQYNNFEIVPYCPYWRLFVNVTNK